MPPSSGYAKFMECLKIQNQINFLKMSKWGRHFSHEDLIGGRYLRCFIMLQFCFQHFSVVVLYKVHLLLLELEFGSNFLQHMIPFVSFFLLIFVVLPWGYFYFFGSLCVCGSLWSFSFLLWQGPCIYLFLTHSFEWVPYRPLVWLQMFLLCGF